MSQGGVVVFFVDAITGALIDWQHSKTHALADVTFTGIIRMAQTERHVRLFRNGRNQAIRIPREFELEGNEAILRKESIRLIVEPVRKERLLNVFNSRFAVSGKKDNEGWS